MVLAVVLLVVISYVPTGSYDDPLIMDEEQVYYGFPWEFKTQSAVWQTPARYDALPLVGDFLIYLFVFWIILYLIKRPQIIN